MSRNVTRLLALFAIVVACATAPLSARRADVTWTLTGVTFADGGTASGSFVYNVDTNTYSAVNITTTLGSTFPGATYVSTLPFSSANSGGFITVALPADQTGLNGLGLSYVAPLTNAGGLVPLNISNTNSLEVTCTDAPCNNISQIFRAVSAGSVLATGVPVPTMPQWFVIVLAAGLAGAAAWKLRRPVTVRKQR